VVIAIIAILASLLLPALTGAKLKTQGIQCMNNHRQLTLAWLTYALDNRDRFLYASGLNGATDQSTWVGGIMDFNPGNRSNWDVSADIAVSPLWPYCGKCAAIFKCPADRSMIVPSSGPFAGKPTPRVRTMSMSVWFGGFGGEISAYPGVSSPPWRLYLKLSDLNDPGATRTALFWDEREDAVNYGNFYTDMTGWPNAPAQTQWNWDLPGYYHGRAGGLSFADGHSELRKWQDPRTMPPIQTKDWLAGPLLQPRNADIVWLQERATRTR
jgi:type II secretory pathway pseudopilin PulG